MRQAVLSMDLEDWYHLDYFRSLGCDRGQSLLDGVEVLEEILARHRVRATFFVLGELAEEHRGLLRRLDRHGHEIASHGWDHARPLTLAETDFESDVRRSLEALREVLGNPVSGYRAPCFSLDRVRLDRLRDLGLSYDSSRMPFRRHPLYGHIELSGFEPISGGAYRRGDFVEFELSVLKLGGRRSVPVAGGAYFRFLPWFATRWLVGLFLTRCDLYTFYVHPFELSEQLTPPLPKGLGAATRLRFGLGRRRVAARIERLIGLATSYGFQWTTFARLRSRLLEAGADA